MRIPQIIATFMAASLLSSSAYPANPRIEELVASLKSKSSCQAQSSCSSLSGPIPRKELSWHEKKDIEIDASVQINSITRGGYFPEKISGLYQAIVADLSKKFQLPESVVAEPVGWALNHEASELLSINNPYISSEKVIVAYVREMDRNHIPHPNVSLPSPKSQHEKLNDSLGQALERSNFDSAVRICKSLGMDYTAAKDRVYGFVYSTTINAGYLSGLAQKAFDKHYGKQ